MACALLISCRIIVRMPIIPIDIEQYLVDGIEAKKKQLGLRSRAATIRQALLDFVQRSLPVIDRGIICAGCTSGTHCGWKYQETLADPENYKKHVTERGVIHLHCVCPHCQPEELGIVSDPKEPAHA